MFDLLDEYTVLADGSAFSPTTADQTLFSLAIPERRGVKYYLVHADFEATLLVSPVVQVLDLELLNDAVVVKTFNFSSGIVTPVGGFIMSFTHPVAKNTVGTISLRLGNAGTADPDVVLKIKNVWVAAVG